MNIMALSCISLNSLSQSVRDTQARISHISTNDSTPLNAQDLGTCDAKEHGIRCQRQASVNHTINATGWGGFPAEARRLCKVHASLLWQIGEVERIALEKQRAWLLCAHCEKAPRTQGLWCDACCEYFARGMEEEGDVA